MSGVLATLEALNYWTHMIGLALFLLVLSFLLLIIFFKRY